MKYLNLVKPLAFVMLLPLLLTSCLEDDLDGLGEFPEEIPELPALLSPNFEEGDGALIAIKSFSKVNAPIVGSVEAEIGSAVATFTDDNFSTMLSAGNVDLDDNVLSKEANNSYVFVPDESNYEGILFGINYTWDVKGSKHVDGFEHEVNMNFPVVGEITSPEIFSKTDGYTLTYDNVSGATEIMCMVGGVVKTLPGNTTSVTFTAEELKNIEIGANFVQVAAFTYDLNDIDGKSYYFGNETIRTVQVEVE